MMRASTDTTVHSTVYLVVVILICLDIHSPYSNDEIETPLAIGLEME